MHVSTLIYYLSNAKFKNIQSPAESLNYIYIDMNEGKETKKKEIIRRKRQSNILNDDSTDSEQEMNF